MNVLINELYKNYFISFNKDDVFDIFKQCTKSFPMGSIEFCEAARIAAMFVKEHMIDSSVLNAFLTEVPVEKIGDYMIFLIQFIESNGQHPYAIKCFNILMEKQVYGLNLYNKKYLQPELERVRFLKICSRLANRILAQIQGYPDTFTKYFTVYGKNIKKYPV